MYEITSLFDLSHCPAGDLAARMERQGYTRPWQLLKDVGDIIRELQESLARDCSGDWLNPAPGVWVHRTAKVAPTAFLGENCIIGPETEVRHCAFIRGNALVGTGCVVGNSTELKNVILFDKVQVPHYNYVGDSILGFRAHMGAGSVTSNVKSDKTPVAVHGPEGDLPTGLKKMGALLGDGAEIGCNSVLNPGTVIGRNATVYPLSCVRGTVPENSIYKTGGVIVAKK